jgi:hypothetical protein
MLRYGLSWTVLRIIKGILLHYTNIIYEILDKNAVENLRGGKRARTSGHGIAKSHQDPNPLFDCRRVASRPLVKKIIPFCDHRHSFHAEIPRVSQKSERKLHFDFAEAL